MAQDSIFSNNVLSKAWAQSYDKDWNKATRDKFIKEVFQDRAPDFISFKTMDEARNYCKNKCQELFRRVARAKERSKTQLVAVSTKGFSSIPVIIDINELQKYTEIFEPYTIEQIVSTCDRFLVIDMQPIAVIMFNLLSRKQRQKVGNKVGGFDDKGRLIIGIDIASKEQEVCFYHDTLQHPVSVTVSTDLFIATLELSHQSIHLFSESCSMISTLNNIVKRLNEHRHIAKRHLKYTAIKNTYIRRFKSRDSKTDKNDATALYVTGKTPSSLLPKSRISDEYCTHGKIISALMQSQDKEYQRAITDIKNAVLELTGFPINEKANGDDVCREAILKLLSHMPKVKYMVPGIISKTKHYQDDVLINMIRELHLLDDKAIDEALRAKTQRIEKRQQQTQEITELNDDDKLFNLHKTYDLITTPSLRNNIDAAAIDNLKNYSGFKDLDTSCYKPLVKDGEPTHLTPADNYTEDEMRSIMFYTLALALISKVQHTMLLMIQMDNLTKTIQHLLVPSNLSMSAATEIPGVGATQAFELAITLGDIKDFPTANDAVAYMGAVPSISSTGHKKASGRRLSSKGRSSAKKSLYLGQMAVSTYSNFCANGTYNNIWKSIGHIIRAYYGMIKNNCHYMPIKQETKGRSAGILKQFSRIKYQNSPDADMTETLREREKACEMAKKGLCSMLTQLVRVVKIRKVHNSIDKDTVKEREKAGDIIIMPTIFNSVREPVVDANYMVEIYKERIKKSLFNDFNVFHATFDSICKARRRFTELFGNNFFGFLNLIVNDASARSYVFSKNLKDSAIEDIVKFAITNVFAGGKKAKNRLTCVKNESKYAAAADITVNKEAKFIID